MIEYIEAFLTLGQKVTHTSELRNILTVLRTTEAYMNKEEWRVYCLLREKLEEQARMADPKRRV